MKVLISILDQLLFSIAGFGLLIALSHSLAAEDFGQYSILVSASALLPALIGAVWSDPVVLRFRSNWLETVYNACTYRLAKLLIYGGIVCATTSLVLFLTEYEVIALWVTISWSQIVLAFVIFTRRMAIFRSELLALKISTLYLFCIATYTSITLMVFGPKLFPAIFAQFLAGLTTVAYTWNTSPFNRSRRASWNQLRAFIRKNWSLGKWTWRGAVLFWLSSPGYIVMMSYFLTIVEVGVFRTMIILLQPVSQVNAAIYNYALPRLLMAKTRKGIGAELRRMFLFLSASSFGYVISIWIVLPKEWVASALNLSKDVIDTTHFKILALVVILEAVKQGLNTIFQFRLLVKICYQSRVSAAVMIFAILPAIFMYPNLATAMIGLASITFIQIAYFLSRIPVWRAHNKKQELA